VHGYLWAVALIYGANYTIAKDIMPGWFSPDALIAVRVSVSAILFVLLDALRLDKSPRLDTKTHLKLIGCSITGIMINQLFFFRGLSITSPSHASLIMTATPIFVWCLALVLHWKRPSLLPMIGVFIGFAGAAWLILQNDSQTNSTASALGDLYIFINAASYALYLIMVKPLLEVMHPIRLSKWVFLYAAPFLLLNGWSELMQVSLEALPNSVLWSVGYVIVFTTVGAYGLNALAMRQASPALVGSYIYLQPVLAIGIALIWGRDLLTLENSLAACCIFIGVYMVGKK
jgi:drug/metabolite transporter (DMT)-like permease